MQFFSNTHIDFLGKRGIFRIVSLTVVIAGVAAAFVRGVDLGIDFEGGTEGEIRFAQTVEVGDVRTALSEAGFKGAEVKSGGENTVILRVRNPEDATTGVDSTLVAQLTGTLNSAFGAENVEVRDLRTVGPKIGDELRTQALWAILVSVIAILLYITFRFELIYAFGAIIALVHDVLVAFAFTVLCNGLFGLNLEMNQSLLAAFLTVVGFSINDTVIIFDRIRENKVIHRGENLLMLMNRSINEVLPRTINTSVTLILVLLILLVFSGEVLQGLAFTMLIGVIAGTYSSIYIASAFVVDTMIRKGKLDRNAEGDFKEHVVEARQSRRAGRLSTSESK